MRKTIICFLLLGCAVFSRAQQVTLSPDQLKEAEAFVLANRAKPAAGVPESAPEKPDSKDKPKTPAKPAPAKPAAKDKR